MSTPKTQTILVSRDGQSIKDGTICKGDYVKCDGFVRRLDTELLVCVQIQERDTLHKSCGYDEAELGDWIILGGEQNFPRWVRVEDFPKRFTPAGVHDGRTLYRHIGSFQMFQWQGDTALKVYSGEKPEGAYSAVTAGDWVVMDDFRNYWRVSRQWAEKHFADVPAPRYGSGHLQF